MSDDKVFTPRVDVSTCKVTCTCCNKLMLHADEIRGKRLMRPLFYKLSVSCEEGDQPVLEYDQITLEADNFNGPPQQFVHVPCGAVISTDENEIADFLSNVTDFEDSPEGQIAAARAAQEFRDAEVAARPESRGMK